MAFWRIQDRLQPMSEGDRLFLEQRARAEADRLARIASRLAASKRETKPHDN
jgi:hypothetical protein